MTDIQWICIWSDVGYQPGGHHVPYPGTTPHGTVLWSRGSNNPITVLRTTLAQITTMDLPVEYKDILTANYIAVLITGSHDRIYGWIRRITEIAGRSPACRIEWEIDNWRTWSSTMEIDYGIVLRRPTALQSTLNIKPQMYRQSVLEHSLRDICSIPATDQEYEDTIRSAYWPVLQYLSSTQSDAASTTLHTITWPVQSSLYISAYDGSGESQPIAMSMTELYSGRLSSNLQIDPNDILGAWVSPICPWPQTFREYTSGVPPSGHVGIRPVSNVAVDLRSNSLGAWFEWKSELNASHAASSLGEIPVGSDWKTTMTQSAAISDLRGNIVWTMPYMVDHSSEFYIGFSFAPGDGHMYIRFLQDGGIRGFSEDTAEGLVAAVSLPEIPIFSNSWNSYLYSGAREYEIRSAEAAAESSKNQGLANTVTAGISGAIAGGMTGNPAQAAAGAAVGMVSNIVGTLWTSEIDKNLRREVQDLKDKQVVNQAQTIIVPGQSPMWVQGGSDVKFISLIAEDDGSWAADIQYNGYRCEIAQQNIILSAGPWQIADADIGGQIPTEAAMQIRGMLAQGIYIDNSTEEEEEEEP